MNEPILSIENLYIEFKTAQGIIRPLNGVSLDVRYGEVFGIVGETGCGKTITGLSVLRLLPRSAHVIQGKIIFEGKDLLNLPEREMRMLRGGKISIIFQDPSSSLNPLFTIGSQIDKVISEHLHLSRSEAKSRSLMMLGSVGLPDVERIYHSYPHQLSGGMLQRTMIAMALSCDHTLVIADEPTTALDVTIQSQILTLLRNLQKEMGISLVIITHNLGVVAEMCDRLAVFYAGKVAEIGPTEAIFKSPCHPYTQGLIQAIPRHGSRGKKLSSISGSVPVDPGSVRGCVFAPRCEKAFEVCFQKSPSLEAIDNTHYSSCFLNIPVGRVE